MSLLNSSEKYAIAANNYASNNESRAKFTFLFFLANVAEGSSHLLGEKKCTWGPSYWCSNIT